MKLIKVKAEKIEERLKSRPKEYSKELNDIIVFVLSDAIVIDIESNSYVELSNKYRKAREENKEKIDYCILCKNKECPIWKRFKDRPCIREKIWKGNPGYEVEKSCLYRDKYLEQKNKRKI